MSGDHTGPVVSFDAAQLKMITQLQIVSSSLSVFGSVVMITCYVAMKSIRTFPLRLILWLNVCNFFSALSELIGPNPTSPNAVIDLDWRCYTSAVMQQFFYMGAFLWVAVLAVNQFVHFLRRTKNLWKYEILYHVGVWGLAGLTCILVASFKGFGIAGGWCWISDDEPYLRWFLFYAPMTFIIVILIFSNLVMLFHIFQLKRDIIAEGGNPYAEAANPDSNLDPKFRRIISDRAFHIETSLYVLAFVVLRTPSAVNRFMELIHPGQLFFGPTTIQAFCSPLLGFACFVVFLKNKQLRWQIKIRFFPSLIPTEDQQIASPGKEDDPERAPLMRRGRRMHTNEPAIGGEGGEEGQDFRGPSMDENDSLMSNVSYSSQFVNPVILVDQSLGESQAIPKEQEITQRSFIKSIPAYQPVSVFVGTWNLGNTAPPDDLGEWIPKDKYDIVAIGAQECNYSPKEGGGCKEAWNSLVSRTLGRNYRQLASVSLREIRITVHIRSPLFQYVTNVQAAKEATGIANIIGNKGGVGIAFNYNGTSFCFVNCHLAAHQEMVVGRNINVQSILSGIHLGHPDFEITTQFYHLFFFGDLNYRIDLSRDEVVEKVQNRDWPALLKQDQLLREKQADRVMYDFKEMEISFPPTYRYHMGSNPREYNPKKGRVPSWCDRILWHSLPGLKLNTGEYNCNMSITTSDHAPVYATFTADWVPPLFVTNSGDLYTAPSCVLEFVKMRAKNLARHHHGKSSGEESGRRIDPFLTMWLFSFNEWPVHSAVVKNNYNPTWKRGDLPSIPLYGKVEAGIPVFLFVQVRDNSLAGHEDIVSQCAIPLASLFTPAPASPSAPPLPSPDFPPLSPSSSPSSSPSGLNTRSEKRTGYRFLTTLLSQGLPCGELSGLLTINWTKAPNT